jgi:hypothetical protein
MFLIWDMCEDITRNWMSVSIGIPTLPSYAGWCQSRGHQFQGRRGKLVNDLLMSKFTYWYICVLTEIIQIFVNI